MAIFKVEAKNKVDIGKKPRVYFTCHPEDFHKYFKKVCDDIFKTHDCAIYYTEDMTDIILEDEKEVDLGRNNLFVVPVTLKLLSTPNRAMDEDIPYALSEHIPILPIMMEIGIDQLYSKPDKFGELQYLNAQRRDITEIPYEEKLKKYLETVLINDELINRVRNAFDAYIFLSYRKKDRKFANELMRLIHENRRCRDIAIWFDEFLTPGESFKENINKHLNDSKLFTLLVTPNLLEENNGKPNFVMGEEYPEAKKTGMAILPAEMKPTDKNRLAEKFEDIPDCINPRDNTKFHIRLNEALGEFVDDTKKTPEHNYLIGVAYLEGIDLEVDRQKGVQLIQKSAENDYIDAIIKMVDMYENGVNLPYSIENAVNWQNRLVNILENKYKKTRDESDLIDLFWSKYRCASLYITLEKYKFAKREINNILPELISAKSYENNLVKRSVGIINCILYSYLLLSNISVKENDLEKGESYIEKAKSFYNNMAIPHDSDGADDVLGFVMFNFKSLYLQMSKLYKEMHKPQKSLEYVKKVLNITKEHLTETSKYHIPRDEIMCNELAGDAYFSQEDFENAEIYYKRMYEGVLEASERDDDILFQRDLAFACNRMGEIMIKKNKLKEAKKYFSKSFEISKGIKMKHRDDEGNIAFCYNRFGDICWYKYRQLSRAFYYRKAFKIRLKIYNEHKDLDSVQHLAYSYVNLGRTSLFRKAYYMSQAKSLFEILIEESQTPDFYRREMETYL